MELTQKPLLRPINYNMRYPRCLRLWVVLWGTSENRKLQSLRSSLKVLTQVSKPKTKANLQSKSLLILRLQRECDYKLRLITMHLAKMMIMTTRWAYMSLSVYNSNEISG